MATPKVWIVTGTSTGIGRVLTETLAEQGNSVVATARNTEKIADYTERFGELVLPLKQDVNQSADNQRVVADAMAHFGRIDVLVNNAGYGLEGPLEELTMEQVRQQMETNFFGLVEMSKRCIPHMRQQGSGCIFNISSIAGMRGFNGLSIYNASKFAVSGFSEAIRQELKPFGVRVSAVEPGPYRTDWAGRSMKHAQAMTQDEENSPYAPLHKLLKERIDGFSGKQPGDPRQIANVLISAEQKDEIPAHMIFGDEAIEMWQGKVTKHEDPTFIDFFPHNRHQL